MENSSWKRTFRPVLILTISRDSRNFMCRYIAALVLALLVPCLCICAGNVVDFIDFSLRASNNSLLLSGRLYVPPVAATSARPLIIFMHGAGEVGTNNTSQVNGNIDNLLNEAKL